MRNLTSWEPSTKMCWVNCRCLASPSDVNGLCAPAPCGDLTSCEPSTKMCCGELSVSCFPPSGVVGFICGMRTLLSPTFVRGPPISAVACVAFQSGSGVGIPPLKSGPSSLPARIPRFRPPTGDRRRGLCPLGTCSQHNKTQVTSRLLQPVGLWLRLKR